VGLLANFILTFQKLVGLVVILWIAVDSAGQGSSMSADVVAQEAGRRQAETAIATGSIP
jgi:hypothetical protein